MVPKCPHCASSFTFVNIREVEIRGGVGRQTWNGIAYSCPSCSKALSVGIDPVALKTDTVNEILRALGRKD